MWTLATTAAPVVRWQRGYQALQLTKLLSRELGILLLILPLLSFIWSSFKPMHFSLNWCWSWSHFWGVLGVCVCDPTVFAGGTRGRACLLLLPVKKQLAAGINEISRCAILFPTNKITVATAYTMPSPFTKQFGKSFTSRKIEYVPRRNPEALQLLWLENLNKYHLCKHIVCVGTSNFESNLEKNPGNHNNEVSWEVYHNLQGQKLFAHLKIYRQPFFLRSVWY